MKYSSMLPINNQTGIANAAPCIDIDIDFDSRPASIMDNKINKHTPEALKDNVRCI